MDSDEESRTVAHEPFPLIGPDSDDRVCAALDERCSAACHSVGLREKAQRWYNDCGFMTEYHEAQNPKAITELGGNTVTALGRLA